MRYSAYIGDPWGWIGNQCGHAVAGLAATIVFCAVTYSTLGEYPHKECVIGTAAAGYLLFEIVSQGWRCWDTLEDWWFFVTYGVGIPMYATSEVHRGSMDLTIEFPFLLIACVAFAGHAALGFYLRHLQSRHLGLSVDELP